MDWKQLPRVDKELVQYLKEKFPNPRYDPKATTEELVRLLAIHYGHEEAITAIEKVIEMQRKGG
tara:strand:- start:483 stop:674 length:192 start_codon:yes stop_codon:yes gene_type:complete